MNTTQYDLDKTAKTSEVIAKQRAENLYALNIKSVLELCVGPSAVILEKEYSKYRIQSIFNDIDSRWRDFYYLNKNKKPHIVDYIWRIGNCLNIRWTTQAVVFAPPLSNGCSGRREDSLMINDVTPSYNEFLKEFKYRSQHGMFPILGVLVLPARSIATKEDRKQFYHLLQTILSMGFNFEIVEMYDKVRKYIDVYITRK